MRLGLKAQTESHGVAVEGTEPPDALRSTLFGGQAVAFDGSVATGIWDVAKAAGHDAGKIVCVDFTARSVPDEPWLRLIHLIEVSRQSVIQFAFLR